MSVESGKGGEFRGSGANDLCLIGEILPVITSKNFNPALTNSNVIDQIGYANTGTSEGGYVFECQVAGCEATAIVDIDDVTNVTYRRGSYDGDCEERRQSRPANALGAFLINRS